MSLRDRHRAPVVASDVGTIRIRERPQSPLLRLAVLFQFEQFTAALEKVFRQPVPSGRLRGSVSDSRIGALILQQQVFPCVRVPLGHQRL
ncbi:hypothetical protein WT24_27070 [Burkholderia sp. MSMB1078WGS]|nr:hypothetical protein WT24_27070 [Burkholderia sp. MSMB1078WGS]